MIHPIFSTLAAEPGLVLEHFDAYADLALAEAAEWSAALQMRMMLKGAIVACLMLGTLLAAIAVLIAAAISWRSMPYPWVLVVLPAVPWLAAFAAFVYLKMRSFAAPFALLREQVSVDLKVISEAGRS